MKFFLDSAIVGEVQHALDAWDINGVTTNPRHVQVSGKPFLTVVQEIGEIVADAGPDKTVSVQTNPHNHNDYNAIVEEARKLADQLLTQFSDKLGDERERVQQTRQDITAKLAKRDWTLARAWLNRELAGREEEAP